MIIIMILIGREPHQGRPDLRRPRLPDAAHIIISTLVLSSLLIIVIIIGGGSGGSSSSSSSIWTHRNVCYLTQMCV